MMPQLQDLATLICRHRKCFFNVPPFLIVLVVNFFLVYHVFLLNFCITLMSLLLPILQLHHACYINSSGTRVV
jgi:hypothetical protein